MAIIKFTATSSLQGLQIDLKCQYTSSQTPNLIFIRHCRAYGSKLDEGLLIFKFNKDISETVDSAEITIEPEYFDPDINQVQGCLSVQDSMLEPKVVYYYTLFEVDNASNVLHKYYASAMATGRYGWSETLYKCLPAFYRYYDEPDPAQKDNGDLRRFLDVTGHCLDQIRSLAEGLRGRHDIFDVSADNLPAISRWIGWEPDLTLSAHAQRRDILFAPDTFSTVGTVDNIRALVTGCDLAESGLVGEPRPA